MKKRYITIFLMLATTTIAIAAICAADINLGTLDYEDTGIIVIDGDVDLEFNQSDTGTNEILFLWRIYSSESNITVYNVFSKTIEYDHTFVNDTKTYVFHDNNSNKTFTIKVDYSSINVPVGLSEILNKTILEKDALIAELNTKVANLTQQLNLLNQSLLQLQTERNDYKYKYEQQLILTYPLNAKINELKNEVSYYQNRTLNLSGENKQLAKELDSRETSFQEISGSWSLGYSVKNPYTGEVDHHINFNLANISIGVLLGICIGVGFARRYIPNKKREKKIPTEKKSKQNTVFGNFIKKKEKTVKNPEPVLNPGFKPEVEPTVKPETKKVENIDIEKLNQIHDKIDTKSIPGGEYIG